MLRRYSRAVAAIVLCFFTWTSGGVFSVAHAAVDGVKRAKAQEQQGKRNDAPQERFSRLTEELAEVLGNSKVTADEKKQRLMAAKVEIQELDTEIRKEFAATEQKLRDAKLPAEILERHYRFVKHYDDNLAEFKENLERVEKAKTKVETEAELEKALNHLEKAKGPSKHQPLDPNKLPFDQRKPQKREPRMKKEEFERDLKKEKNAWKQEKRILLASTGSMAGLLGPDELAETIEVQLTPEIRAKALELGNSPHRIYEWVRNNIEFVPTWGSIQGAQMTLQTRQGNAFDTASLLVALLRAAGVPSRYVTGTIELPIEKVMNWGGGFTDPMAALDFFSSGGVPTKGLVAGGKVVAARMEHVWVEAFVDYIPSRGAKHKQGEGDIWIKLDPSFKQYIYAAGMDVQKAVPFDGDKFLADAKSGATINEAAEYATGLNSLLIQQAMQDYQSRLKTYIQQSHPDATVADMLGKKEIVKQKFPYLLGTLPYRTAVEGATFASVPDSLRHRLSFRVEKEASVDLSAYDPDAPAPVDSSMRLTKSLPELAGKKITLSYSPATSGDEAVLNSYLPKPHADGSPIQPSELPSSLPAYLINLKPELRVDGEVVAAGEPVGLGGTNIFTMTFSDPTYGASSVTNYINAGSFNAVGLNVSKISAEQIAKLQEKIAITKGALENPVVTEVAKEDYIGDILYAAAISYHSILDLTKFTLSRNMAINSVTLPSENIFSYPLGVRLFFGIPLSVNHTGVSMDADTLVSVVKAKDGNNVSAKEYMLAVGMSSSALEHSIPELIFSTPTNPTEGVSAVKALKIANDQGIPIYTVSQNNITRILPQLSVSQFVKAEIQNAINAGKIVTVSKSNISYKGWTGCGYIVIDPETGAGAYMISSGLSGFFALLGAYFSAIADIIAKDKVKGFVNVKPSPILQICANIGKALNVVGYAVQVADIVANPKLSEVQKILEILVWLGAVVAMLQVGALIGGVFTLLPAMLIAILAYVVITAVTLLLIEAIEKNVAFLRFRQKLLQIKV